MGTGLYHYYGHYTICIDADHTAHAVAVWLGSRIVAHGHAATLDGARALGRTLAMQHQSRTTAEFLGIDDAEPVPEVTW